MSDPRTTADGMNPTIAAREREVEHNRERLASTVDALQSKLDVKAQAEQRVRSAKRLVITADGRPRAALLAVVAGLALGAALVWWRRR